MERVHGLQSGEVGTYLAIARGPFGVAGIFLGGYLAVQGTITLQTSRPLGLEDLVPTLETLLRMNGAALVRRDGTYHVVPRDRALKNEVVPQLGAASNPLPKGYSVRLVPLNYIGAAEMAQILEPFAAAGSIVRIDPRRNMLLLAGAGPELEHIQDVSDLPVSNTQGIVAFSGAQGFMPPMIESSALPASPVALSVASACSCALALSIVADTMSWEYADSGTSSCSAVLPMSESDAW